MRPVERIDPMIERFDAALRTYWMRHPDMRMAQVLANLCYEIFGTAELGQACLVPDDELDARLGPRQSTTRCATCLRDLNIAPYHFVNNECPDCHCCRSGTRRG